MAVQLDQQQLQIVPVNDHLLPDEGPKAIPLILDFTGNAGPQTDYALDLSLVESRTYISMVQTLFIDMSGAGVAEVTVTFNTTNQQILAKPNTQGYYNVLATNPTQINFHSTNPSGVIKVFVINVAIPGAVWAV